mgnify:FL=1
MSMNGNYPDGYSAFPQTQVSQAQAARQALQAKLQSNSTIVLVLGILSIFVTGIFTSIVAWVWGGRIEEEAQFNGIPPEIVSNAKIGKIIGMIITILYAVVLVAGLVIFLGLGFSASN